MHSAAILIRWKIHVAVDQDLSELCPSWSSLLIRCDPIVVPLHTRPGGPRIVLSPIGSYQRVCASLLFSPSAVLMLPSRNTRKSICCYTRRLRRSNSCAAPLRPRKEIKHQVETVHARRSRNLGELRTEYINTTGMFYGHAGNISLFPCPNSLLRAGIEESKRLPCFI